MESVRSCNQMQEQTRHGAREEGAGKEKGRARIVPLGLGMLGGGEGSALVFPSFLIRNKV